VPTTTVHLPDGHTADICDSEGITAYAEQTVLAIYSSVSGDIEDPTVEAGRAAVAYLQARVELLPHVIKSWSYPKKITLHTVSCLPRSVRATLVKETSHLLAEILSSVNEDADPKSPGSSGTPE
jgi:hypothetical protein